jgi:hypothetical protein
MDWADEGFALIRVSLLVSELDDQAQWFSTVFRNAGRISE